MSSGNQTMGLFDLLSTYPLWGLVLAVVVIVTFVLVGVFVLIKRLNIVEFRGIKRGDAYNDVAPLVVTRHSQLIDKGIRLAIRHTMIKNQETIRDQMNMAEMYLAEVSAVCKKHFSELMKEYGASRPELMEEYVAFARDLSGVIANMLSAFRFVMRDNHLAEKGDKDMDSYIEDKLSYLQSSITVWFNEVYRSKTVPLESFLQRYDEELFDLLNRKFRTILRQARVIAMAYERQIKREMEAYNREREMFYRELPMLLRGEIAEFSSMEEG